MSSEGSLYELVARGNKDVFFYGELSKSKFLFDNSYESQMPSITELRRVPPLSTADFGRSVEFSFDLVGDLMKNPTLLIQLPTWLPPSVAARADSSIITDLSGVTYGYTRGIAYFLFESIQFFQDNILLQEFSGDTLWVMSKISGTVGEQRIVNDLTGDHDGSLLSISRAAAPPTLRLELPIIGTESTNVGFPQRAVTKHSYRLRCKLRKVEDLIESSDGRHKPFPWGQTFQQQLSQTSQPAQFKALVKTAVLPINLQLETRQIYVERDMQQIMETTPIKIRFPRVFENVFSQGPQDYISVLAGGLSAVQRRIDGRHPAGRLIWYFRSISDILSNRLWKINTNANKPYYNTVSLLIAGRTRESDLAPFVWRDIVNYGKEGKDSGLEISTMNWTLGDIARLRFPSQEQDSTGAVNFTTADRPTFYINLANPGLSAITNLYVIEEGWSQFETDGHGRAELLSMN